MLNIETHAHFFLYICLKYGIYADKGVLKYLKIKLSHSYLIFKAKYIEQNISIAIIGKKNNKQSFREVILNNLISEPRIQIDIKLLNYIT